MSKISTPYGVSLEALKITISGFHRAQAHIQGVTAFDIADTIRYQYQTVHRQIGFLKQVGIITESKDFYKLTESGFIIARALDYGKNNEYISEMQKIIRNWKQIQSVFDYIREASPSKRNQIEERILMNTTWDSTSKNTKMGVIALVDMFVEAKIIEFTKDKVILLPLPTIEQKGTEIETEYEPIIDEEIEKTVRIPLKLTHMKIRNVRSFAQNEFPAKKMNILIGENSSGKSSVLHSLLSIRNLLWGRDFANGAYYETEWLRRRGSNALMNISFEGEFNKGGQKQAFNLSIFFTPSLSYITQMCTSVKNEQVCDTSIFSEKLDIRVPFEELVGLKNLDTISVQAKMAIAKVTTLFANVSDSTFPAFRERMAIVSLLETKDGTIYDSVKSRRVLGEWPQPMPEGFSKNSKSTLVEAYLSTRANLRRYFDSLVFIPVIRGFQSLTYAQSDEPPQVVTDETGFESQIMNKMIFPDEVDSDTTKRIRQWAERFDIYNFEAVLQPGRRIEPRGWIHSRKEKLPIALYGFGSNQFLVVICRCLLAQENSPILIEEPEIHLHPKHQAQAADFLIEIMNEGHQLFVTTHSEHIIGRLQRRIAEGKINPDDLALLWVRKDSDEIGSIVEEVEINEKGILHEGLTTYLNFIKEEMVKTEQARHKKTKGD